MKVIRTILGWEIQPETNDEEAHMHWLVERFQVPATTTGDTDLPCPRCSTFGNYDGRACLACGFNYRLINEVIANATQVPEVRTFTTKGPIE